MSEDSWPGDCGFCEAGKCDQCSGITMEGFGCECAEAGHFGLDDDVTYDAFDEADDEVGPEP